MNKTRWTNAEFEQFSKKKANEMNRGEIKQKSTSVRSKVKGEEITQGRPIELSETGIEAVRLNPPKRKNKFNAKKTTIDGITFDSKKEANRYLFLKDAERNGQIRGLKHQVVFNLKVNDQPVCKYVADFIYQEKKEWISKSIKADYDWVEVTEDVKSPATRKLPVYRLKKKMMKAIHGIEIKEV